MIDVSRNLDILMLGTFSAWQRGTIQSRALPFAIELQDIGYRVAILTTSWDMSCERAVIDSVGGVPIILTHHNRASTLPQILIELRQWVRRLDPTVLHLIKPRGSSGLFAQLQLLLERKRRLVTVDLDDWEGDGGWNDSGHYGFVQRRVFDWQERRLPRHADHIFAASHLLYQREVRRSGGKHPSISYVPNGLTTSWFQSLRQARLERPSDDRPRVILYSRFAEFPEDWPVRFTAALGNSVAGPISIDIVGEARRLPITPDGSNGVSMTFHGYVPRRRIPAMLGASDVAIYPYEDSLISRSKQSVKLLELMAAGCAVIGSDIGEVPGIVGNAGILVQDSSPESFASAVRNVLGNRARLNALSSAAIERIGADFLIPGLAEGVAATYRNLGLGTEM